MIDYETLNPGIRETVRLLRENGFATSDSGDGVTHEHACDQPVPYVHITVGDKHQLIAEADRLAALVATKGVSLVLLDEDGRQPYLQADYSPGDGICSMTLWNVTDAMLVGGGA